MNPDIILVVMVIFLPIYFFGLDVAIWIRLFGGYPSFLGIFLEGCLHWWKETGDTRICTRCKERQVRVFSIDTWLWIPYDIATIMGVNEGEV